MHVRTVTFAKSADLCASQMVPPFGSHLDLTIQTSFRFTSRSLQRWRNLCFETLAQMAILLIFSRNSPGFRSPLRIPSLTDNSGTESGGNKLFSTTFPMNVFLEKLTTLCAISGMELDLSHIAGDRNDEAGALSRWDFEPPLHSDMVFATEWIYRYRIFGYHVAAFPFTLQIHICSGNLRELNCCGSFVVPFSAYSQHFFSTAGIQHFFWGRLWRLYPNCLIAYKWVLVTIRHVWSS